MDNDDVIDTLNDLIETSKDGEYGFRASAENAKSAQLKELFAKRAADCRKAATELQAHVARLGGEADDDGSAMGAMHRGWVAVKGKLAGYSDLAMLEECERGEDVALASYRKALDAGLPADVLTLVDTQYDGVKRNHAQIRTLRDEARALDKRTG